MPIPERPEADDISDLSSGQGPAPTGADPVLPVPGTLIWESWSDQVEVAKEAPDPEPISDEELAELEVQLSVPVADRTDTASGDRSRRRQIDQLVVAKIAETGYKGDDYERLFAKMRSRLVAYGWPIMDRWMQSRNPTIFERVAPWGFIPFDDRRLLVDEEDRAELACETVSGAAVWLHDHGLPKRKWRPERGAGLDTYFVGACLQRFPRCYRKWLRERQVRAAMESALSAEDLELVLRDYPMLGPVDPARQVVLRDEVERALKGLDIQTRTAVILQDAGYPQTEAAAQAGLSIDALSGRLRRYRWRGESNGE